VLAAGIVVSFTTVGLCIAVIGFAVGLEASWFRLAAALLLMAIGAVLVAPVLQTRFAIAVSPVSQWASGYVDKLSIRGPLGQFCLGLLFGAVWAPCVGPTLGAAGVMASKGHNLHQVFVIMTAFSIGVALPLFALGTLSSSVMAAR